jgi:hypothetical protein
MRFSCPVSAGEKKSACSHFHSCVQTTSHPISLCVHVCVHSVCEKSFLWHLSPPAVIIRMILADAPSLLSGGSETDANLLRERKILSFQFWLILCMLASQSRHVRHERMDLQMPDSKRSMHVLSFVHFSADFPVLPL